MAGTLTLTDAHRELAASDPAMAALISEHGPRSIEERRDGGRDGFAALARIVTGQQVSTAAARTIWGRVRAEFGGRDPGPAEAAAGEARLRACGLSGRKASYISGLGRAIAEDRLDPEALRGAEDEAVIERLVAVKGIGRWSAEMFLMFHLGRPDVFSPGDLGLRNGIRAALDLGERPGPEEAAAIAERWRPHRTLASIYLWAAASEAPA